MADKQLHITNGSSFTERLRPMFPNETILTWNEMLCEGPAPADVLSDDFIQTRTAYLTRFEPAAQSQYQTFVNQFDILDKASFDTIIFWFEYDLFCHINLAAAIPFVASKSPASKHYLVCSGTIPGQEGLFGLGELSEQSLTEEYNHRVLLESSDVESLSQIWKVYASDNHSAIRDIAFNGVTFPYLSNCLQAHLERFPLLANGLNALELKVLEAIEGHDFKNNNQLVGYLLRNQGYYGFGDLQWFSIVDRMSICFNQEESLSLNERGRSLLAGTYNALDDIRNPTMFGGTGKYDYLYNPNNKALEKR
ncbi:MAG: DUF1835 domain-containing protein [Flavobacteriaceae bacterium]|nr:DUF1835 domain-containing protein [Flavobacteriaceae bacterium]